MLPLTRRGTVYGTLLNHRDALAALGDAVHQPPYKAAPKAPILYIKPRNTWVGPGDAVVVPHDVEELEIGATLGLVIGRVACRVREEGALDHIAGYVIVNDVSVPHASYYRPSLRFKARDTFCPIGSFVPRDAIVSPDDLKLAVEIDGEVVHRASMAGLIRPAARLLAEVSAFMTLEPGDVLSVGVAARAPRSRAGQTVSITIEGLGRLDNPFVAEEVRSMSRTARVAYGGAIHHATPHADGIRLADGRVLAETDVVWLAPFDVGTIIALGINYADHAKELAKELTIGAKDEPLAFLKAPNTLIGHRGMTRRPADATFMHYECELAVVIGQTAKKVRAADAMRVVAGYTVANDYAIRDYLENYYRPNLRVKNRDGCTALGPWLVDAADVPDPHTLDLRTRVNGKVTQRGNTRDLINDVPALIEYLSGFMTLSPGDVILTGTPEGVVNVNPGDEVVTEIDGVGRLINTIVGDDTFGI